MKYTLVEHLLTRLELNPATVLTPDVRGVRAFIAALCDLAALVRDEYISCATAMNHKSETITGHCGNFTTTIERKNQNHRQL